MGRVIKNADTSEVTSVSLDEDVLAEGADRIPAEQVEETEGDDADPPPGDAAPQGRVLRAGEAGRSPEPVTVRPDEIATQDASGSDPAGRTTTRTNRSRPGPTRSGGHIWKRR